MPSRFIIICIWRRECADAGIDRRGHERRERRCSRVGDERFRSRSGGHGRETAASTSAQAKAKAATAAATAGHGWDDDANAAEHTDDNEHGCADVHDDSFA